MTDDGPKSRQQCFVIFSIESFTFHVNTANPATNLIQSAYMS